MQCMGKGSTPSLSNHPNNPGKKHNVSDKMLHKFPTRKAHSVPGVCSSYLNMVPENYTLVSNRRELPVPWTPGTTYELFPSDPISGKSCTCACQEQGLHIEVTEQFFSRFYDERVREFFVNSSVLAAEVYVSAQPSGTKQRAGKTRGTHQISSTAFSQS